MSMTIRELEHATQGSAAWATDDKHDVEDTVLALIADNRALKEIVEYLIPVVHCDMGPECDERGHWPDCAFHRGISARQVLADLKCKE